MVSSAIITSELDCNLFISRAIASTKLNSRIVSEKCYPVLQEVIALTLVENKFQCILEHKHLKEPISLLIETISFQRSAKCIL